MGFIERAFNSLVEHLLKLGLKKSRDDFRLIDSITASKDEKKIAIFLLGVLLDRTKNQSGAIYKRDKKYEVADNIFEIFFAIKLPISQIESQALIVRILSDFEQMEGAKVRLLNSYKDLQDNLIVREFLKNGLTNAVFVKVTIAEKSLKDAPIKVLVSDVKVELKKR